MATRADNLKVTSVSVVDRGANPKAMIALAKRAPQEGETPPADEPMYKRVLDAVGKALGVKKSGDEAMTFSESMEEVSRDRLRDEIWEITRALTASLASTFDDNSLDEAGKAARMKQSVDEFAAAAKPCIDKWTAGEAAIDKSETGGQPPADITINNTGESGDMNINKGAMSAEDKATYEAIARKYGVEDADVSEQVAKAQAAAKEQIDALNDVVKKLTERIEAQAEAARDAEMLAVAKKYELLGQKPEELAKTLKPLPDDARAAMLSTMDAALKATEQSGIFSEIGKRGTAPNGDAWAAIEKRAAELRKADAALTREQSIVKACDEKPELVAEYEGSR